MNTGFRTSAIKTRTVRLIATANHKPPVLEQLVASFGARSKLELLESVTSGRLNPRAGAPAWGAVSTGYGRTYINAAFAYPRHSGSRFSPKDWGAWYAAFEAQTALDEVGFHLTRALTASGCYYDNTTRYIELLATFDDDFADLRDVEPTPSCLHPDEALGYPDGQQLGSTLRAAGGNGVVYPSVRHAGGTCIVAFWPHLVLDFQQGATWELVWAGSPSPAVARVA